MKLITFIILIVFQSYDNAIIFDDFEYCSFEKNMEVDCDEIKEINIFEEDICTDEIYISFKTFDNDKNEKENGGFLNRERLIQEKSEEIECNDELDTFISNDKYDIFRVKNNVYVNIKNKDERLINKITEQIKLIVNKYSSLFKYFDSMEFYFDIFIIILVFVSLFQMNKKKLSKLTGIIFFQKIKSMFGSGAVTQDNQIRQIEASRPRSPFNNSLRFKTISEPHLETINEHAGPSHAYSVPFLVLGPNSNRLNSKIPIGHPKRCEKNEEDTQPSPSFQNLCTLANAAAQNI
jgi:hypothetical protein